MESYTARYERQSDGLWRAQIEQRPEIVTAARTLSRAKADIHQAAADHNLAEPLHLIPMSSETEAAVISAHQERARATAATEAALVATRRAARALVGEGFSYREAGTILGLSHTRVQQLADELDGQ